MERLTLEEAINHEKMMAQRKRWNGKFTKVSLGNKEINKRFEADCIKDAEEHEQFAEWLEELKSYKEAEEHGLLVRLPCKVGTEVYYILGIPNKTPCAIDKCVFKLSDIDKIGESLFLTHKEAEKKLEEMKND